MEYLTRWYILSNYYSLIMPLTKDNSPVIPIIGSISQSSLLQRRATSKETLHDTYYRYDEYDNVSLLSLTPRVQERQNSMFTYTEKSR